MDSYILAALIGTVIGFIVSALMTRIAYGKISNKIVSNEIGGVDIIDIVEDGIPYQQWQIHVSQEAMKEIKDNDVIGLRVKRIKGGNE